MARLARLSLQAKLILAFVLVMLIPTVVFSAYTLMRTRSVLLSQISAEHLRVAEARAATTESRIAGGAADLLFIVEAPALRRFARGEAAAIDEVARTFEAFLQQSVSRYSGACLLDTAGQEVVCVRGSHQGFVRTPEHALRSRHNEEYFLAALRQAAIPDGQPVAISVSDQERAFASLLRYTIPYPEERGFTVGIVALEAPLWPILADLADADAGTSSYVVDSDGAYLFHQTPQGRFPGGPAASLGEEQPHDAQTILRQPSGTVINSPDRPGSFQTFTRVRPLSQSAIHWTVIYERPLNSIVGSVRETQFVILVIAVTVLMIALTVSQLLASGIVRPIRGLAEAAERVGAGDLGAAIPQSGGYEVAALGRTLDHTVARLRESLAAAELRRQEAETLRAATEALGSTLARGRVLELILSELRKVIPYDSASVQEVNGAKATVIGCYGLADTTGLVGTSFSLEEGTSPNAEVARLRAPVMLEDAAACYPHFNRDPYMAIPIRSWLGVPMIFGERLVGMITLDKHEPGYFTAEQVRLAVAFAAQAAAAMENARLYEAAQRELEERQRAEEELRQAQKMEALGRLAGGLAHDFNNVLTVILGEADLMLSDLPPDHLLTPSVEQIRQSGLRAAALIRQLLAFSRRQVLQTELLSLNDAITGMEQILRRLVSEEITIRIDLAPDLPAVRADPGQIEQVVLNLALNARDAMPRGGNLLIATALTVIDQERVRQHPGVTPGTYITLTVHDTGVGMDEQTRGHIFEPFFTTKPRGKGTGLGLATVHGIVRQSGGHIWFESAPGQGTTFRIYLPAAAGGPQSMAPDDAPAVVRSDRATTETVLVVEDDEDVRCLARQILARQGFTVLEAGDGLEAQAIASANTGPISVLLTDVVMPGGMNGVQLAAAIRALRPQIRVLYMSGYTENVLLDRNLADDGAYFVQKPFTPDQLVRALIDLLT